MTKPGAIWVCFAVKEEAGYFQKLVAGRPQVRVLVTGMGRQNAERTLTTTLQQELLPRLLITSGFAGGLSPELVRNTVVFAADDNPSLQACLKATGARSVQFHCAERVVTTVGQKRDLWARTGCEAVEMESQPILSLCDRHQIPAVTVRIILDTAEEDLPLDFNLLMDASQRIDSFKLARLLIRSPWKIFSLLRLQRRSMQAARQLGQTLEKVIAA
jgi:nucleoside phosphorylase